MATIKNLRHGRIRILSGDTVPLVKVAAWTEGDFTWSENHPTNIVRDRGSMDGAELTKGDDQPVEWSFSAKLVDETLMRTMRDKVWDGFAQSFTGLTPSANNLLTPTYDFEQDSVAGATGETIVLIANGGTPASDNELAESVGAADVEKVIRVPNAAGSIQVYQPAADTDRDLVYDAVGQSTVGTDPDCSGGRKTFKLILDIYDPCDPPNPTDLTLGTVVKSYELDHSFLVTPGFAEGDEADIWSFAGQSLIDRVAIVTP